jgi:hypothetical protein
MVNKICDKHLVLPSKLNKIYLKAKITTKDFRALMDDVNQSILMKLFGEIDSLEDDGDEPQEQNVSPSQKPETQKCSYWLSQKLADKFELNKEKLDSELLKELTEELLDIIETEYF